MSNAVAIATVGTKDGAAKPAIDPAECVLEPERPTVAEAHKIMQVHLRCGTAVCQHRKLALVVLVEAGHYVLR